MVTMSGTTPWVSKPQGVGFAPAADKKENPERVRQPGLEPEGILHDVVVEIAGVGVEDRDLLLGGPHHPGVTVSDVGDVVRRIQVGLAVLIVKELPKAAHDLERPIVRHAEIWSEAKTAEQRRRGAPSRLTPSPSGHPGPREAGDHVAKIDDPRDRKIQGVRVRGCPAYENVVVVGIVVDDAFPEKRQAGDRPVLVPSQEVLNEGPASGVADMPQTVPIVAGANFMFHLSSRSAAG
jgi:hypothetical protein